MSPADVIHELARRWNAGEGIGSNIEERRAVWESTELDIRRLEVVGEHGKIASVEWFTGYDAAVAAARGA
jgi:hypothetical protein